MPSAPSPDEGREDLEGFAIGDWIVPGCSELVVLGVKEAEVNMLCLLEGAPRSLGMEVMHWVWVANRGPDPLTAHDGQPDEEWWKEGDMPGGPGTYPLEAVQMAEVLSHLEPMLRKGLSCLGEG